MSTTTLLRLPDLQGQSFDVYFRYDEFGADTHSPPHTHAWGQLNYAAHGVMQDTAVGTWHSHSDRRAHRPDILQVRFYIAAYNAFGYEVANGCRFCREKNLKFFRGDLLW